MRRGMPWRKTGATHYHAQLGLLDKGRAIKGLVVCNCWDLEPLDLITSHPSGIWVKKFIQIHRENPTFLTLQGRDEVDDLENLESCELIWEKGVGFVTAPTQVPQHHQNR